MPSDRYAVNGQNYPERKGYNRLVAQTAKNIVKKKLIEIRRGGARAADDFLDQMLNKNESNRGTTKKSAILGGFDIESFARAELDKNRGKWRNFIIEAATRFDPDALACFGVNFIYGGLMTASVGNIGWASVIKMGENAHNSSHAPFSAPTSVGGGQNAGRAVSEYISRGRARGNMVWIIEGKGLFSSEMLKTYRFAPDIAFILLEKGDKNSIWCKEIPFEELSQLKNILTVIPDTEVAVISEFNRRGMLYALSSAERYRREGNKGAIFVDITHESLSNIFEGFIRNPTFPIRSDRIFELFNGIEQLLSGGKSDKLPEYRA